LVLNATDEPLCVVPSRRAVVLVLKAKAEIVQANGEAYHSEKLRLPVPSVVRLTYFVKVPYRARATLSRRAVFIRDGFECQYCAEGFPTQDLTFDHVIPRSRGGRTIWENVVTACGECNLDKGNRLPRESGMFPIQRPYQPTTHQLQDNGRRFPPNFLHHSWRDFLYWDVELES